MHATDLEVVEFSHYQLKDIAYQWYKEQKVMRGNDSEQVVWDDFSYTFLDHFFPQGLRKSKAEEFVNLKQGKMSVKEHTLKFQQLVHYALELVSNMRSQIRKITSGLSHELVLEYKDAILNNDMDISRLMVYMQQVKKKKQKKAEMEQRMSKVFRYLEQGTS